MFSSICTAWKHAKKKKKIKRDIRPDDRLAGGLLVNRLTAFNAEALTRSKLINCWVVEDKQSILQQFLKLHA